jgi:hypothetical protein
VGYVNKFIKEAQLWRGFQIKAIDGSSTRLLDTKANQEKYPQPPGQAKGCGFPVMGFGGVINLSTGCVEALQTQPKNKHDLVAAHELIDVFWEGDLVLADRAYNSYGFVAQLLTKGVHSVMRLHPARASKLDWRKGKKLGKNQRLVKWQKPKKRSECLDQQSWDALPDEIEVRYIKVKAPDRNGKLRSIYVATTLIDPVEYPETEIAWLYQKRWDIEVKFRDIKTTLGYEQCRVNTPEMAEKTMKMVMLAYNLIKALQAESIYYSQKVLDRVSFKQTVDLVISFSARFLGTTREWAKRQIRDQLFELIDQAIIPARDRPNQPRLIKTRPKYDFMTIARSKFRSTFLISKITPETTLS